MKKFILLISFNVFFLNVAISQWQQVNNGLDGLYRTDVMTMAVSDTKLFAGTRGGSVFLLSDGSTSWKSVLTTNKDVVSLAVSGINLFAGAYEEGIFRSTDNGTNWTKVNTGLTDNSVMSLAISNNNIFAGTYFGIFRSTDNGSNWTSVNSGLTSKLYDALAVQGNNVFVGSHEGAFLSSNNGASWSAVNNGLGETYVLDFAISGNNIFAGTFGKGVLRSYNNGASWSEVNIGMTVSYVTSFAISGNNIFAGTMYGKIFLSTNSGQNWTAVDTGLPNIDLNDPNFHIQALAVSNKYLYAGTNGSGIWRRPLSELVTTSSPFTIETLSIKIYPNPSKDGIFRIENERDEKFSISIYDLNCKLISTSKFSGKEMKLVDLSKYPKGIYIIRLFNEKISRVEKLVKD